MKWMVFFISMAAAGSAISQAPLGSSYIAISKKTPSLVVKVTEPNIDAVPSYVEMDGRIPVRATVSYGWFEGDGDGVDGTLMVHLLFSKTEWAKMPHYKNRHSSQCDFDCEFHLDNGNDLVETLFDSETLSRVRSRQLMQVRKVANLVLWDIGFGNDCGIHYSAKARLQKQGNQSSQIAMNTGFDGHC